MVLKADRERVKTLLKDTITLLCKNGLEFKSKFSLEALIGVTLDEGDVMLISINEMVKSDSYRSSEPSDGEGNAGGSPRRKKRKRTHKRRVKTTDEFVVSGDEANTDSDGSSNSGAEPLEPVEKKPCEDPNACDDKSGGDLVFVKQEVPDGWDSGSVSHNLPSTSVGNQGQDNFAALPDIGLTEIDGGEGASWMLSAQEQSDIAQLSGSQNNLGTSALTSSQDGAQMFDQQQSQGEDDEQLVSEKKVEVIVDEASQLRKRFCLYDGCTYWTYHRSSMSRHQRKHADRYNQCMFCEKQYIEKYDLTVHIATAHNHQYLVCKYCGKKFTSRAGLALHEKKHLGEDDMIPNKHVCQFCGKGYERILNFKSHMEQHPEYSENIEMQNALEETVKATRKKMDKNEKMRFCNIENCTFSSPYRSSMIRHEKRSHSKNYLQCPVCNRSFVENYDLKCHLETSHGNVKFTCEDCGKEFKAKRNFIKHQKEKCSVVKDALVETKL